MSALSTFGTTTTEDECVGSIEPQARRYSNFAPPGLPLLDTFAR
ncbi:MAG: hypothetical protein ABSA45_05620 [Verrucomicrobiota bacterium]